MGIPIHMLFFPSMNIVEYKVLLISTIGIDPNANLRGVLKN